MRYLELFISFLKLGSLAFGGAYGAIPLFREEVLSHGWLTDSMFTNIVAISESTPGPIMLNIATYIGAERGGISGAILATLGVILPSYIIILLVTIIFKCILNKSSVQSILKGMKQCIMGIMLATGLFIGFQTLFGNIKYIKVDVAAIAILAIVSICLLVAKKKFKKELPPIIIILICAALGGILY
nr:chromate transporter [uncultured Clostridium sp.]